MGTNSEFCSDERVGYTLLKSFLAGDVNANRCYAGLSPEEQQRLVSGAKSLRTPDEVASYVWDYLDRQGRSAAMERLTAAAAVCMSWTATATTRCLSA